VSLLLDECLQVFKLIPFRIKGTEKGYGLGHMFILPCNTGVSRNLLFSEGGKFLAIMIPDVLQWKSAIALVFMLLGFLSIGRGVWKQVKSGAPEVALEDDEG
jgi:hypothetical protein